MSGTNNETATNKPRHNEDKNDLRISISTTIADFREKNFTHRRARILCLNSVDAKNTGFR